MEDKVRSLWEVVTEAQVESMDMVAEDIRTGLYHVPSFMEASRTAILQALIKWGEEVCMEHTHPVKAFDYDVKRRECAECWHKEEDKWNTGRSYLEEHLYFR